jgi:hypothetical protein
MGCLLSIQLQQQEKQQLKEVNWSIMQEGINPGNHEMGWLFCIQLQQQDKWQLKWIEGQWRKELIWEIMKWVSCYPSSCSSKRNNNWR